MSDKSDELLDVVTASGRHLEVRPRSEVHAEGLWHQTFHCLVVRTSEPPSVVLQRRHRNARAFPDKLDLSATGHLDAGESPIEGIRELTEELGIAPDPSELVPLGVRLLADDSGEGTNRERTHVFLLADDRPLDEFEPDPDEVDGLVEITTTNLLTMIATPTASVSALAWSPGGQPEPVALTASDLIEPTSGYWTVVTVMAERFARGERPIAI